MAESGAAGDSGPSQCDHHDSAGPAGRPINANLNASGLFKYQLKSPASGAAWFALAAEEARM